MDMYRQHREMVERQKKVAELRRLGSEAQKELERVWAANEASITSWMRSRSGELLLQYLDWREAVLTDEWLTQKKTPDEARGALLELHELRAHLTRPQEVPDDASA